MQITADALVTALIGSRFEAWIEAWPGEATRFGLHRHDGRLADLSRAAKEADIAAEHAYVRRLEAVDPAAVSDRVAFERELALHSTHFERPVARAEVHRYTTVPGYNLSYLLGKVLLLRLRADEQARLGQAFSLKSFHDALLYSGSLPISCHRRLLAGEGGGPIPAAPLEA